MGLEPIVSVKVPVTIGTVLHFDGDRDGDGNGVGKCKHTLIFRPILYNQVFLKLTILSSFIRFTSGIESD